MNNWIFIVQKKLTQYCMNKLYFNIFLKNKTKRINPTMQK